MSDFDAKAIDAKAIIDTATDNPAIRDLCYKIAELADATRIEETDAPEVKEEKARKETYIKTYLALETMRKISSNILNGGP